MRAFNNAAVARAEEFIPADRVHQPNEVPANPVTGYAQVSVTTPGYNNVRNDATAGGESYRIVVLCVGRDMDEVGWVAGKAKQAFMGGHRLAVPGYETTPVDASEVTASSPTRDPDAGEYLTATLTYPFNAYPTE